MLLKKSLAALVALGALVSVPLVTPAVEAQATQCRGYTTSRPWGFFNFSFVETGNVRCSTTSRTYRAEVRCYRHNALVHTVHGPWAKSGNTSSADCYPGLSARASVQFA